MWVSLIHFKDKGGIINTTTPGEILISGYDPDGTGPGTSLHMATIHWIAMEGREDNLSLTIDVLADETGTDIGEATPRDGIGCTVKEE